MINLYFDAEFTGLHKDTTQISIGIVSASGESFYAELNNFADYQISPWIKENVLSNTVVKGENKELAELLDKENTVFVVGSKYEVRESLLEWLKHFESDIQFVSDVSHYDFVLLVDLLASSALELPNYISASCHDINQDIARVLRISEKEAFDLSREQLLTKLGKPLPKGVKHNALYDAKIMPKDLLTIVVSCTSPELAAPFNLTVATQSNAALSYTTTQPVLQQYLVDNDGNINFPVLGELHVGGLTKKATEQMIVDKLKPYITETPIVTVRMMNYKISVIGEVARPGTFTISNEKVNILEALAMAGDMTVYGLRDDVKLIRENANGKQEIIPLDLNKAETILSPYYYLQQNDIIYVTPNKAKARNSDIGTSTSLWFSATSILVSIASLLFNILK